MNSVPLPRAGRKDIQHRPCAAGHGMAVGALAGIAAYSPKVYISSFRADATILGLVMLLVQVDFLQQPTHRIAYG